MSKNIKKQAVSRVATKDDLDQIEAKMATNLKQLRAEMATKEELKQLRVEMATKEELKALERRLNSRMRVMEGTIKEDFDIKLEEKFTKYTDKVTRSLDQVMGELVNIREDNIVRNSRDKRVDHRLDRLEKHTGLLNI